MTSQPKQIWPFLALAVVVLSIASPAQDQFRQLYLSGKVVLEDGAPLPDPAIVRLYCPGERQPQAYTDAKGNFNFPVGGSQHRRIADASSTRPSAPVGASGSDRSHVRLTDCELRAALPGYTSSVIYLGRRSVFESTDIGTLILTPHAEGGGTFVSASTFAAPKKAAKAFDNANKELAKDRPNTEKAIRELEKAVAEYPQFAAAWNLLGEARARAQDLKGARQALLHAVATDAQFIPPLLTLALLDLQERQPAESVKMADRALALSPNLTEAHYYRAAALVAVGKADDAQTSIEAVHASADADRFPRTHFLLGNIYVDRGDIPSAAREFRRFLEMEPDSRAAAAVEEQLNKWEASGLLP